MSRKEIQTIILLSLGAVIIWALTACEKKSKGEDEFIKAINSTERKLNLCRRDIESSIEKKDDIWFYKNKALLKDTAVIIVKNITVYNYNNANISLSEIRNFFADSNSNSTDSMTLNVWNTICKLYDTNNICVDVDFIVNVNHKWEKWIWRCYFAVVDYYDWKQQPTDLFYCQLVKKKS